MTPKVRWLNDQTLFSSFSPFSALVPWMSGRENFIRASVTSTMTDAREMNGTTSCATCTSSIAMPPNTIPVTKYGAIVVPTELAVPPMASLWMDCVPFTSQATR